MKQFVRSVPVILFLSVASLSLIALAGCGGSSGPTAAKSIYVVENTYNRTTSTEQDSVAVFSASATGSTTPTSTLTLPSNFYGYMVAVGPKGQIYVGGYQEGSSANYGQILEYPAGSSGSATPSVTLNGSSTGTTTFDYPDALAVNSAGTLFVSGDDGSLEAFASGFTASSAPTRYLTWGQSNFDYTGMYLGADTAGDIFYVDEGNEIIDVFAASATGATAPVRTITGTNTNSFNDIWPIAVDGAGDVYVVNYNSANDPAANTGAVTNPGTYAASRRGTATGPRRARQLASHQLVAHPHTTVVTYEPGGIIEFAAGATGNATPLKRIGGTATKIAEPLAVAVDAVSNLYYADDNGGWYNWGANPSVLLEVFPSSATGNVAPAASITSTNLTAQNSSAVAVY